MPKGKSSQNAAILEYALTHLEKERDAIQEKIDHIRKQLGSGASPAAAAKSAPEAKPKKRNLSPAARKRIAAAQKKRWAEHKKKKAAA